MTWRVLGLRAFPLVALLLGACAGGTRTSHLLPVPFTQRVALQSGELVRGEVVGVTADGFRVRRTADYPA